MPYHIPDEWKQRNTRAAINGYNNSTTTLELASGFPLTDASRHGKASNTASIKKDADCQKKSNE